MFQRFQKILTRLFLTLSFLLAVASVSSWILSYFRLHSLSAPNGPSCYALAAYRGRIVYFSFTLNPAYFSPDTTWEPPSSMDVSNRQNLYMRAEATDPRRPFYVDEVLSTPRYDTNPCTVALFVPVLPNFSSSASKPSLFPAITHQTFPHWLPTTLASLPLLFALLRKALRKNPRSPSLCPHCSYDLRAHLTRLSPQSSSLTTPLSPRCPECGTPIPPTK